MSILLTHPVYGNIFKFSNRNFIHFCEQHNIRKIRYILSTVNTYLHMNITLNYSKVGAERMNFHEYSSNKHFS